MALVTPENCSDARQKKVNHRNKLDKIFSIHDDINLIRGILAHGKKWKLIWEKYNLKHINRMSLKDRARSKAFKVLLERAREDINVLDDHNKINLLDQNNAYPSVVERKKSAETCPTEMSTTRWNTEDRQMNTDTNAPIVALSRIDVGSERRLSRFNVNRSLDEGLEATEEEPLSYKARNSFMDSSIAGFSRISIEQNMIWMNSLNFDENEIDLASIECDLASYENLSPRIQWGGPILEDMGSSPQFVTSSSSVSAEEDFQSCQELKHCAEV